MSKITILIFSLLIFNNVSASTLTDKISRVSDSQLNNLVKSIAESLAKDTPTQINSGTILTGVIFVSSPGTLIYNYEISKQYDPEYMHPLVIKGACTNEILRAFLGRSIKIKYNYTAPNGKHLFTLNVVSTDCTSQ